MNTEQKIMDLLAWVKARGFPPEEIQKNDLYLCPITKRMLRGRCLNKWQREHAFWIPNRAGIERHGFKVDMSYIGGCIVEMKLKTVQPFQGAGVGESEAAMSLLNNIRRLQTV